jgi:peptidoglycan/LPS O-acetylase OafA/YrhL
MQSSNNTIAPIAAEPYKHVEASSINDLPSRLYLLDIIRGFASLAVVVWHYQYFFYIAPDTLPPGFTRDIQPLYPLLFLGYEYGFRAVQLFFVLSGFVFFFQYSDAIRTRSVSPAKFFVLRFSRLYPLHFATLIVVALGQVYSRGIDGQNIIYPCNDGLHFGLHIFLVMEWMPLDRLCHSFNFPTWSISVEMLLYAIFFLVALRLPKSWEGQMMTTLGLIFLGLAIGILGGPRHLGEPLCCFFAGGLAYLVWSRYCANVKECNRFILLTLLLFIFTAIVFQQIGSALFLNMIVFPTAILLFAALQCVRHDLGRSLRVIGDITYSTYLLHFPVQLGMLLLVKIKITMFDFTSPSTVLLFLFVVIALSIPTHYYFERPMQRLFRRLLLTRVADSNRADAPNILKHAP